MAGDVAGRGGCRTNTVKRAQAHCTPVPQPLGITVEPTPTASGRLSECAPDVALKEIKMTIRCLLAGCSWSEGVPLLMGGEPFVCQCCSRCGSHRYTPQP